MSPDILKSASRLIGIGAAASSLVPTDFPNIDKAARDALNKAKEGEHGITTGSIDERYGSFPGVTSAPNNEQVGQGNDTRVDLQKQVETDDPSSINVDPFTLGLSIIPVGPEDLDLNNPEKLNNIQAIPRVVELIDEANNYISEIINQRAGSGTELSRDGFSIEFGVVPIESGSAIGYVIVSEEEGLAYLINPVPDSSTGKFSVSTISIGNPVSEVTVTGFIDSETGQLRIAPVFTVPGGDRYLPSLPGEDEKITVDNVSGVEFLPTTLFSVPAYDTETGTLAGVEIRPTSTPFPEGASNIPSIPDVIQENGEYFIFIDGQKQEVRMRNVVHIDGVDVPNPEFGIRPAGSPELLEPEFYITGLMVGSDEVDIRIPNVVKPGETVEITVRRVYVTVPLENGSQVTFRLNNLKVGEGDENYPVSSDGRSDTTMLGWGDFVLRNDPRNQAVFTIMKLPSPEEIKQSFIDRDGTCTALCEEAVSYFALFDEASREALTQIAEEGVVTPNEDGVIDLGRGGVSIIYPGTSA